jgi:hypothetical protein
MKSLKNMIRLWIGLTSFLGFLGAWIMLAQSFKPLANRPVPAILYPTLSPLAPMDINSTPAPNISLQVVTLTPTSIPTPQPQPLYARILLTTGGS